jgi:hypothetical protein
MRLGLIGTADGDLEGLARAAEVLLNGARVTRAIYLGVDAALETVVARWAESLVGSDPSDEAIWSRAREAMGRGTAEIDDFVRNERARLRLRALEALPQGGLRSVEMFGDRMIVLIHDKAMLDEEDIYPASFLVYGKSDLPLIRQIGPRWFLSPGRIGCVGGGALVLDDASGDVELELIDGAGATTQKQRLPIPRGAKMQVRGAT